MPIRGRGGPIELEVEGELETVKSLDDFGKEFKQKALLGAMMVGAEIIRKRASKNARGISDRLADNIIVEQVKVSKRSIELKIGPDHGKNIWWGLFFETGVGPHRIVPNDAQALQIGADTFRAWVEHPGFKKHPWMRPAFRAEKDAVEEAINDHIEDSIRRASAS